MRSTTAPEGAQKETEATQDITHPHLIDVVREAVRAELAAARHARSTQALLTTSDAAQRLGCSPKTVRKLIAEGRLPSHRFGGQHRIISREAIEGLLTE